MNFNFFFRKFIIISSLLFINFFFANKTIFLRPCITKLYLNVILSPYNLKGYLIGYLQNDSEQSKKVIDEWKKCYPIKSLNDDNGYELPRVLVILIVTNNNYRLFYPISYVYSFIEPDEFDVRNDQQDCGDDLDYEISFNNKLLIIKSIKIILKKI